MFTNKEGKQMKLIKWILSLFKSAPKTEPKPVVDESVADEQNDTLLKGVVFYKPGSLSYIEEGLKLVGNKEIPGSKDNPVYTQIYIDVAGKSMHDEVANCQYFVQAMLKRGGYKWKNTGWAADLDSGKLPVKMKDLKDIAIGDVCTKLSTVANSKRHVFFIIGIDYVKKQVLVLEANASNSIKNTNWYPFDILRACGTPIKA